MRTLTTSEATTMLEEGEAVFLNVGDRRAFDRRHIPGSQHVPIAKEDFLRRVAEAVGLTDRPIVVYCNGRRSADSATAAKILKNGRFTKVYHYGGGIDAWTEAGGEAAGQIGRRPARGGGHAKGATRH